MGVDDSKRFYWLKLRKDFFQQHQIKVLKSLPNGRLYALIYLELLAESTSHNGELRYSELMPYDVITLSAVIDEDKDNVEKAIETLCKLGLTEILEDRTIYMNELQKMIGSETGWASKKRKQKTLPKLIGNCKRLNSTTLLLPNGKTQLIDEKRYGGNGMLVMSMADGRCEICGSEDNVRIHHNNGYSCDINDLVVLCGKCHGIAHDKDHKGHIEVDLSNRGNISTNFPLDNRVKSIENRVKSKDIFIKPTIQEISDYIKDKGYSIDPEYFFNYYESKGWMIGKNKMKNWKAALSNWNARNKPTDHKHTNYDNIKGIEVDTKEADEALRRWHNENS